MTGPFDEEFFIETFGPTGAAGERPAPHTLLVRAGSSRDLALAERTLRVLGRSVVINRAARQEERIERLIEAIIEEEPLSATDEALDLDNAALRARYLETVPTYSAADLHALAGSVAANRGALAFGWKKEGRAFAVPYKGADRFPRFQFTDGQPRPVIRHILRALPEVMSPWQVALWFASGNGWLGGAAPADRLADTEKVVAAAGRMREQTIG